MQIRFGDLNDYYQALDIFRRFNVPLQEAAALPSCALSLERPMTASNAASMQTLPQATSAQAVYQQPFVDDMPNQFSLAGPATIGGQRPIYQREGFANMLANERMTGDPACVSRPVTAPYRLSNDPPPKRELDFTSTSALRTTLGDQPAEPLNKATSARCSNGSTAISKTKAETVDSDCTADADPLAHSMPEKPTAKTKPNRTPVTSQPQAKLKTSSRSNRRVKCEQCRRKRVKCVRVNGRVASCEACSGNNRKCSFGRTVTSNRIPIQEELSKVRPNDPYVQVEASQEEDNPQIQAFSPSDAANVDFEPKTMADTKHKSSEVSVLSGQTTFARCVVSQVTKPSSMILRSAKARATSSRATQMSTKPMSPGKNTSAPRTPLRAVKKSIQTPLTDATLTSEVADLDLDPKTPPDRGNGLHLPLSLTAPDEEGLREEENNSDSLVNMHEKVSLSVLDNLDLSALLNQPEDEQAVTCDKMIAEILDDDKFLDLCRLLENNWRRRVTRW